MSSEDEGTEMVTITAERFRQLEEAEALLAQAQERLKKRSNNNIERLNAYNKEHPEKAKERRKKYIEKNREAYNAKRREARRIKREEEKALAGINLPGVVSTTAVDDTT